MFLFLNACGDNMKLIAGELLEDLFHPTYEKVVEALPIEEAICQRVWSQEGLIRESIEEEMREVN